MQLPEFRIDSSAACLDKDHGLAVGQDADGQDVVWCVDCTKVADTALADGMAPPLVPAVVDAFRHWSPPEDQP